MSQIPLRGTLLRDMGKEVGEPEKTCERNSLMEILGSVQSSQEDSFKVMVMTLNLKFA